MKLGKNITAFSPVLLLLIAVLVSGKLFEYIVAPDFGNSSWKFDVHLPKVSQWYGKDGQYIQTFDELKYRMLWAMSVLFFALAYIINIYFVLQVLSKLKAHKKWLLFTLGLLASVKVYGVISKENLLPAEVDFTFNKRLLAPLEGNELISWIVDLIEYGGALMLFVLAFICFLILLNVNLQSSESQTYNTKAHILFRYDRQVRLLLYGATLTLVAGTLHSAAIYTWSLTMVNPEVLISNTSASVYYYEDPSEVSGAIGAINGLFYTLLIITIFAPTFAILRNKAKDLALEANPGKPRHEIRIWLKEKNLDQGFSEQILPILSTLGPALIGGPLINLLEVL